MNSRSLLLVLGLSGAALLPATAQDTPAQLNTPPTAPDTVAQQAPVQAAPAQPRYRIGLVNGAVYAADDVEMRQPAIGRSYLLLNGQQRFELDQIKFFDDETGHYIRTNLPGSRRMATMRREKTGRISTYSITSQQYSPGAFGPYGYGYGYGFGRFGYPYGGLPYGGGYPYGGYRTVKTEYFSKDGGPIQDMNYRSLRVALSDNPGSAELLQDVARLRRFSTAGYIVGGGLLAAGMLNTFNGAQRISPLVFLSVPVLLVPTFLSGSQSKKLKQAVQMYNYAGAAAR
ncbi:hypothetical protein EJV47_08815 [Hymenobacter gummosus]|uniref:Uncharacterized protein n=1 Tax=Hymenobacter gummosus TaxID=1776032 RepID=A0A3S0JB87_9BACT|nr:hypothetical protein [Hymenobacter gummosus]RTQ50723.1 hypothetical protein EJV47_08815 [Hymenobacter gummosus]